MDDKEKLKIATNLLWEMFQTLDPESYWYETVEVALVAMGEKT